MSRRGTAGRVGPASARQVGGAAAHREATVHGAYTAEMWQLRRLMRALDEEQRRVLYFSTLCSCNDATAYLHRNPRHDPHSLDTPLPCFLAPRDGPTRGLMELIKDWVEKKVRRQLAHAQKRKGFGWGRWSKPWLYNTLKLFSGYRVRRDRPKVASAG